MMLPIHVVPDFGSPKATRVAPVFAILMSAITPKSNAYGRTSRARDRGARLIAKWSTDHLLLGCYSLRSVTCDRAVLSWPTHLLSC